jgi:hypothetical protein
MRYSLEGILHVGVASARALTPYLNVSGSTGLSFRNKSSKDVAFPHPKPRKDKYRNKDKPNSRGIVWNFFKRTINITEYRNGKDNVYPANNRSLGGVTDHLIPFP